MVFFLWFQYNSNYINSSDEYGKSTCLLWTNQNVVEVEFSQKKKIIIYNSMNDAFTTVSWHLA